MLRVGVDLIEVDRVRRSVDRFGYRFLNRVFTEREQSYCDGRAPSLAARFAIKEAVAKALGTGIGEVCWKEIEVANDLSGRPSLFLHGAAQALSDDLGLEIWEISLAHSGTHAVGMVVAMTRPSASNATRPAGVYS